MALHWLGRAMLSGPGRPVDESGNIVRESAWRGYLKNVGVYTGNRALCDARGTVLADFRTTVTAKRFRSGPHPGDDFLLWRTSVHTIDGTETAEEEWSRDELTDFGALAGDGSFSKGPNVLCRERFTIEQCVCEDGLRVRSIHAYDWEGLLCGVTASRERREDEEGLQPQAAIARATITPGSPMGLGSEAKADAIEPAAWRSPTVLLDYILGEWQGRGVLIDRATDQVRQVSSELTLRQGESLLVHQVSGLSIDGSVRGARVKSRARQDGNVLFFPESRVQLVLLPGGMSAASPIRVQDGQPFVVETAFLVRPDCRKRVVRCYNSDCEWINTVFLTERRVG